jgi:hypothetical protein
VLRVGSGAAPTFHGRDVFAPAAAALASGAPIETLGALASNPTIRRTPEPHRLADGRIEGLVISVDRFGNAITNLVRLRDGFVEANGVTLAVRRTYSDVEPGTAIAIVGSSGLIELAVREGNAARELQLTRGSSVVFRPS